MNVGNNKAELHSNETSVLLFGKYYTCMYMHSCQLLT